MLNCGFQKNSYLYKNKILKYTLAVNELKTW